ncbi:MAG: hypothetical protein COT84_04465 [Chlamydiae bacterium CG10_big_fil_rev_8_21_14_0_10_35_9]|nr:MAG: hypothetical protein COT84_04465 [Chlamydiae bacterium CG10_big_fil_rev_8_21_14_0_10_35_9]
MHITFLGTRGNIKPSSKKHKMHTSLLLEHGKSRVMIDCGESWLDKVDSIRPTHIVITHAHPDHAFGLQKGSPCPVWTTKKTWNLIDSYPISKRKVILLNRKTKIGPFVFEAFSLIHSLKAPAVGYKINDKKKSIFYAPDVAWIDKRKKAMKNIDAYIGDGATIFRSMIRKDKETGQIFGHANVRQQLTWCQKEKVSHMIITHCGSDIVTKEVSALKTIQELAEQRGVFAEIAYDGLKKTI